MWGVLLLLILYYNLSKTTGFKIYMHPIIALNSYKFAVHIMFYAEENNYLICWINRNNVSETILLITKNDIIKKEIQSSDFSLDKES